MIDGLIRWSLSHRTIVVALAAAFLVWGGWTANPLGRAPGPHGSHGHHPRGSSRDGSAGDRIARHLPIESALNGAAGCGASVPPPRWVWPWCGSSSIGARTSTGASDRHGKAHPRLGFLAAEREPPFLAPVSSIMGEVLFIDLESDRHSPLERTVAETSFAVACWPCRECRR